VAEGNPRFSYYNRLSAKAKAIYRKGDAITSVLLPGDLELRGRLHGAAEAVGHALAEARPSRVRAAAQRICDLVTEALGTERVAVSILRARPRRAASELHGLYTRDDGKPATIRLWMRTAARGDVVKPRTFLRTLVHELCHHLDYTHYRLGDSFHNPGFFKRESSLMRLMGTPPASAAGPTPPKESAPDRAPPARGETELPEPQQLRLEF
jgi:hypothetical protein